MLQDVLRRTLETGGTRTLHVRNITDVDDKTIRDSQKAGQSLTDFTAGWTEKFHADCEKLGLLPPHIEPGAVDHIPQQIAMIETLVAKGHAYASDDGSVYFKISSFPGYGRLSHLDERELDLGKTQNARANSDEYEKDSVSDFVLWKARQPEDGENFWPSPWGEGRPGWHLECSAMIQEYLGDSFDLHSGGVDLVFPHHENEIAQSECACGGHFAAHWFHITHLLVDGGKMSKSLGNLYTLDRSRSPRLHRDGSPLRAHRRATTASRSTSPSIRSPPPARRWRNSPRVRASSPRKSAATSRSTPPTSARSKPRGTASTTTSTPPARSAGSSPACAKPPHLTGKEAAAALAGFNRVLRALGLILPEEISRMSRKSPMPSAPSPKPAGRPASRKTGPSPTPSAPNSPNKAGSSRTARMATLSNETTESESPSAGLPEIVRMDISVRGKSGFSIPYRNGKKSANCCEKPLMNPPNLLPSRRKLLKGGLASAIAWSTAPLFLSPRVLGRPGNIGPNSRINVGIIGNGLISVGHRGFCLTQPATQVVALCDVDSVILEFARWQRPKPRVSPATPTPTLASCAPVLISTRFSSPRRTIGTPRSPSTPCATARTSMWKNR